MTFDTTAKGKKDLPAAVHQKDHTTRPQMVKESWNSGYHELISSFKKETGVSATLNTSFNLHGYPIVYHYKDALKVFKQSGLKYLAIENFLISKNYL